MTLVWIWTIAALAGLVFSIWNARDAGADLLAVERNGELTDDTHRAARFFRDSERLRSLQLGSLAFVGAFALVARLLPPFWERYVRIAIGWALLAHVVMLVGNTVQATAYRLTLKEGLTMRQMLGTQIRRSAKAVAAFVVGTITAYLARRGVAVPDDIAAIGIAVVSGIVSSAVVWFVRNEEATS